MGGRAAPSGFRYRPMMSSSFSANAGSLLILKVYTMRFQIHGRARSAHAGLADADALRQTGADGGLATAPWRVVSPRSARKRLTPARNFFGRHGQENSNVLVLPAGGREQHDARPLYYTQRQRAAPHLGFQHRPLLRTQRNDNGYAHPQSSPYIIKTRVD